MKKEIILLILAIGFLSIIGGLEFFLKEKSFEQESESKLSFSNHPPKVETRGISKGCGIAVVDLFWFVDDADIDDHITAYQIQIDDNSDFSNCPGKDCLFDNGKKTNVKNLECHGSIYKFSLSEKLPNAVYSWRVRVWDSKDIPSVWDQAKFNLRK